MKQSAGLNRYLKPELIILVLLALNLIYYTSGCPAYANPLSIPITVTDTVDLPVARALNHLDSESVEPQLDSIVLGVKQSCSVNFDKLLPTIKPFFEQACLLPDLIEEFRSQIALLADPKKTGISVSADSSMESNLMKKYSMLKSLSWNERRYKSVDAPGFVAHVLLLQLAIGKSFQAYVDLADVWNGHRENSNLHMYIFPKIMAYLESSSSVGSAVSYYENIRCNLNQFTDKTDAMGCFNYKAQVAIELAPAAEKIEPLVSTFIASLNKLSQSTIPNLSVNRAMAVKNVADLLAKIKSDRTIKASDLLIAIQGNNSFYETFRQLIATGVSTKIAIASLDTMRFYLSVSSLFEISSISDDIWSIRSYLNDHEGQTAQSDLSEKLYIDFNKLLSFSLKFLEFENAGSK